MQRDGALLHLEWMVFFFESKCLFQIVTSSVAFRFSQLSGGV